MRTLNYKQRPLDREKFKHEVDGKTYIFLQKDRDGQGGCTQCAFSESNNAGNDSLCGKAPSCNYGLFKPVYRGNQHVGSKVKVVQAGDDALCITAMYMAMGANDVLSKMHTNPYETLSEKRGGHIGIMGDLVLLAAESENRLKFLGVTDYPGVYDYEVSEPFGTWFAENDPTHNDATTKLHEMIAAFLKPDEVPA